MINALTANKIALQVLTEPIEEQIITAVNKGKFFIHITNLDTGAAVYFSDLGYDISWIHGSSRSAFISWYK